MKTLDTIQKYHSGVKVESDGDKVKITVDGKDVDPKSKQGKRIVHDFNGKIVKLDSVIKKAIETTKRELSELENIFKGMFGDDE